MKRRAFLKATLGATSLIALAPHALSIYKPDCIYVALFTRKHNALRGTSIEVDYKGYSRAEVPRDTNHWDIKRRKASNKKDITFGACTGGNVTITDVAIYFKDLKVYQCKLTSSLAVSEGITPEFSLGNLTISEL